MKPNEILQSLKNLDIEDDDHWTQDGQPRLDAVGENVTRAEIHAVAPLFNRDNQDFSSPAKPSAAKQEPAGPPAEEKLASIQEQRQELQAQLIEVQNTIQQGNKLKKELQEKLESLREEEKVLDKRTPAECNRDLLKSNFNHRLKQAAAQQQAYKMIVEAGLPVSVRDQTLSELDKAVAARNVAERRRVNSGQSGK